MGLITQTQEAYYNRTQTFTGDGSDRTFDLSYTPSGGAAQQILDAFSVAVATNIVYVFDDGKPFFMNAGDVLSVVG